MIEHYIDFHDEWCNKFNYKFETCYPNRVLLFIANDFYLFTFNKCICSDKYDFVKWIVNEVLKKTKVFSIYEIRRGVTIEKALKEWRMHNEPLKKKIEQVNYIYSDNSGKEYAITTSTDLIELICNDSIITENYLKAKAHLENKNYEFLYNNLEQLYKLNRMPTFDDVFYHQSIEHAIKTIKQIINNGNN